MFSFLHANIGSHLDLASTNVLVELTLHQDGLLLIEEAFQILFNQVFDITE